MNDNSFKGQIPNCLGNLPDLNWLSTAFNHLGRNSMGDLEFITGLRNCTQLQMLVIKGNNFGGNFPNSVANLSVQLAKLDISLNHIRGIIIPTGMEKFVNLNLIDLSYNLLHGSRNQFSGRIPPSIGNLTQLIELDISSNRLEGAVPSGLGSCLELIYLDLSGNALNGTLPEEVFNLPSLTKSFNLSYNLFTGNLPRDISLEYLYLQGNSFDGTIPPSLASLKGLRELDLSLNKLLGRILTDLQSNTLLQYLNLSFNQLEGEVPKEGIFSNSTGISLMGNTRLCGGVSELQLPRCPAKPGKKLHNSKPIVLTVVALLVALSLLSFLAFQLAKRSKKRAILEEPGLPCFTRVSYRDLYKATDGFSQESSIGSGSFGTVYRGKLDEDDSTLVAVKVLNLQHRKVYKSLTAECNALRSIRHRNLKGEEFKALVFEYMTNGSLEEWLHGSRNLSLAQRLDIAVDVANALHYLHDLCETPVVHRDLKPGNVLLDDEMVGHVSDFGIAKLLSIGTTHSTASTIGVQGTVGYTAPEYGMGSGASKEGDMYSFGILVLEMFSGRRPTDEMFKGGLNLHDYIMDALPDNLSSLIDTSMLLRLAPESSTSHHDNQISEKMHKCLVSVLDIGVTCSAESPQQRTKIADVVGKLHHVREDFLRNSAPSVRARTYQAI
ncbi:Probable LRR receptor-like serine/threonine-protein kinase At3g47570 [Linum perenne]